MPKKVLITGVTGAIGNMVLEKIKPQQENYVITVIVRNPKKAKKLKKNFPFVNIILGDITNKKVVEKAAEGQEFVIHLAAIIPTREDVSDADLTRINVEGTRNIVESMEKISPNAMLFFSSSVAIYGDRLNTPYIRIDDELPEEHNDAYGVSKIEAEKIIKKSSLNWSIFRLSAIMGIGNHQLTPLMFHMPLDTLMEYATVNDTAQAFVNALEKPGALNKQLFNLSGGDSCRITYKAFMERAFKAYGLGSVNFPEHTFAFQNFHCNYYEDAYVLNDILNFRSDSNETYFNRFHKSVNPIQRALTRLVSPIVKKWLTSLSEPYKAHKKKNQKEIEYFFGSKYKHN